MLHAWLRCGRRNGEIDTIGSFHETDVKKLVRSPREHIVDVNDRFHDAIIEAAHNARLLDLIRRNREFYFNFRIARMYTDPEAEMSLEGHNAIFRADRKPRSGCGRRRDALARDAGARSHPLQAAR